MMIMITSKQITSGPGEVKRLALTDFLTTIPRGARRTSLGCDVHTHAHAQDSL